jgi:uncharacterized UBP type Zn finger protein
VFTQGTFSAPLLCSIPYSTLTYIKYLLPTISRHYVAFIRKEIPDEGTTEWVLYNDEKVVRAVDVEEMKKFAYVYFFKRTS